MKKLLSLKVFVLSATLLVGILNASARSLDGQLIYNSVEKDGVKVGQTVYKMNGTLLTNYMQYNYKYDDKKRMIESELLKWNANKENWEKDLKVTYLYEGKTITTHYYKWNEKKQSYILDPEMTVTMDNIN